MQRLGTQRVRPANERGVIGDWSPVHPAEPAQDQVLIDLVFRLLIAPLVQVFQEHQAQEHFHWTGVSPMHQGIAMPLAEIITHPLIQRVVVQQPIQLLEHWIDSCDHLRDMCKDILHRIAIDQHGTISLHLHLLLLLFYHFSRSFFTPSPILPWSTWPEAPSQAPFRTAY